MSVSPPEFGLRVAARGSGSVVYVTGEIDLDTAPRLRTCLDRLTAASDGDVVIDLGDVQYIDSSGLHVLLAARARLAGTARQLQLSRPSEQVRLLLHVSGVGDLFDLQRQRTPQDVGDASDRNRRSSPFRSDQSRSVLASEGDDRTHRKCSTERRGRRGGGGDRWSGSCRRSDRE